MVAAIVLACGTLTLIRTNGVTGDADSDLEWRWTETPEQRLLAQGGDEPLDSGAGRPVALPAAAAATPPAKGLDRPSAEPAGPTPGAVVAEASDKPVPEDSREPAPLHADSTGSDTKAVWPGFRGPERDSAIRGVRIDTDWSRSPPVELWRRPIGPGWSSFAVARRSPVHAGAAR